MTAPGSALSSPAGARGRSPEWGVLAGLVVLCVGVGAVEGVLTAGDIRAWYGQLVQPSWTPPNAVFGPVWTALYILIGVAGWIVHRSPPSRARDASWRVWWVQLVLNWTWSPLFFIAHAVAPAVVVIALLWVAIAVFIRLTWPSHRAASLCFVPYLLWVSYATSLNVGIWWLN